MKIRSYSAEVIRPLFNMEHNAKYKNVNFGFEFMGFVNDELMTYPLFYVTIAAKGATNLKDVLISGGVHGEEPAGVYTLLKFLEHDVFDFLGDYRFFIFPCINPFGFERGYRFSSGGVDVNRNFKQDTDCLEAIKVLWTLSRFDRKFVCTIDLHETDPNWTDEGFTADDNPKTFYMWETASDKSIRIGDKVIGAVKKVAPVCDWANIYGDANNGGVIWYPEGCGNPTYSQGTTLDAYLYANYTPQSFTLETPCGWAMAKRVATHIVAIRKILELKLNA